MLPLFVCFLLPATPCLAANEVSVIQGLQLAFVHLASLITAPSPPSPQVSSNSSFAYYNRGIAYDRLGDFVSAVADFSTAISLDPNNADFYHNRGFSRRKMGQFEAALSDYTQVKNPMHSWDVNVMLPDSCLPWLCNPWALMSAAGERM